MFDRPAAAALPPCCVAARGLAARTSPTYLRCASATPQQALEVPQRCTRAGTLGCRPQVELADADAHKCNARLLHAQSSSSRRVMGVAALSGGQRACQWGRGAEGGSRRARWC